ncbi:Glucooligosaccharide oxidase [Macrolepiota fuliginosa MF-IS2]|uniref:Glucooligosaccharide oxidase n=1 Tax=Macrolepiota fuliginosa MF-IS2 TaxID=1400762 RepID=A0A9P5XBC6_9AGAR|nr:Glucooligosaccharide oxidase [Macrolepiota fuliginosa MF-IS2]
MGINVRLFRASLLIIAWFTYCVAGDLVSDLKAKGIEVVGPGQSSFGSVSAPFNRRFTFQPAAVTFPKKPEEISNIIQIATKYQKHVVARSGGHSYIANGIGGQNGAIIIDVNKHFTHIQVNTQSNTAVIETGNRLGDIALALNSYGRGIGHGTCPYVGIGGHASFGGFGYASRLWGMALDAITSMNVVLANGTIVTASKTNNSELFWGMRGAGPSFGITTSITVKTFPVPPSATVFLYTWDLPAASASNVLDIYQTFSLGKVPLGFGSELLLSKGNKKGRVSVTLQGVWFGSAKTFNGVITPLLGKISQKPQTQQVQSGTYIDSVAFFGDKDGKLNTTGIPDDHSAFYVKSLLTPEGQPMTQSSQRAFMEYLANEGITSRISWFVEVEEWGGPGSIVNAVPLDETAFANRDVLFLIQFYGNTFSDEPPFPQSGFTFVDGMVESILNNNPTDWSYSAYPNYLDDRLQNWQHLYFGQHYDRLQRLKGAVDPGDMFKFPTSIEKK